MNYRHAEAFALMTYRCKACATVEVIWNSRDGVTPFGVVCKVCEKPEAVHVNWSRDVCNPNYMLLPGQRFFRNMTMEDATALAERIGRAHKVPPEGLARLAKSYYEDGQQPFLDTHPG